MSEPEDQIYGQGIDLLDSEDRQWDITIQNGDVAIVRGVGELEKDISYKIRRTLGPVEGILLTPTLQSKIENAVTRVLNDDPRIREVDSVTVEMVEREIESNGSKHDELLIDVECTAIGSGVDLEIVL